MKLMPDEMQEHFNEHQNNLIVIIMSRSKMASR